VKHFAEVHFANLKRSDQIQRQPYEVWIYQREYFHDVAVVEVHAESSNDAKYRGGMPVQIQWGWLPHATDYFHGYVHHTEHIEHKDKPRTLRITCIGSSYPMKAPSHKVWKKATKRHIAATLAKHYRFSATIEDDRVVMPTITQHGQSDWDMLVNLAQRAGYTFFVHKTHMFFHERVVHPRPHKSVYFLRHANGAHYRRNSVYSFKHMVGETIPGTARKARLVHGVADNGKRVTYRVDPDNCDVLGTVAPPVLFGEMVNHRPVHSGNDAATYLKALNNRYRFHYKAKAVLSGDVKVTQTSTIRLHGIDSSNDGYWYVTEVAHHITLADYTLEVELGRDSMGSTVPVTTGGVSVTGKPIVFDGCSDLGVDEADETIPETLYQGPEDCPPVTGDLSDASLEPSNDDDTRIPLQDKKKCACCRGQLMVPHRPHLGVWKAKHVVVKKPPRVRSVSRKEPVAKRVRR